MQNLQRFILIVILFSSCTKTEITKHYANGSKKEEITYFDKKHGDFKIVQYFENGQKSFEGTVEGNMFVGKKINYYDTGVIREVDSLNKPCRLDNCCCDGVIKRYGPTGIIEEMFEIANEEKNGAVKVYDSLGLLEAAYNMKDGKKNGLFYKYFEDGVTAFKATFVNDTIEGYALYFYGNGDTLKMMKYKGDNMNFPYLKWLENGQILKGEVVNEGKHISWTWMDRNRNTLKRELVPYTEEIIVPE